MGDGEICHLFYSILDTLNRVSNKIRNNYHIQDVNSLKELVIRATKYINMESELNNELDYRST